MTGDACRNIVTVITRAGAGTGYRGDDGRVTAVGLGVAGRDGGDDGSGALDDVSGGAAGRNGACQVAIGIGADGLGGAGALGDDDVDAGEVGFAGVLSAVAVGIEVEVSGDGRGEIVAIVAGAGAGSGYRCDRGRVVTIGLDVTGRNGG